MELKDIVLRKGDVIYFKNGDKTEVLGWNGYEVGAIMAITEIKKIIKIERPTIIYKAPKELLDKEEKEYLEVVLRPFKDKIVKITKCYYISGNDYIKVDYIDVDQQSYMEFPSFKSGAMYKGMELDKEYTLEELGLFKEE